MVGTPSGGVTPGTTSVERLKEKVEEIDSSINSFKGSHRENYEVGCIDLDLFYDTSNFHCN